MLRPTAAIPSQSGSGRRLVRPTRRRDWLAVPRRLDGSAEPVIDWTHGVAGEGETDSLPMRSGSIKCVNCLNDRTSVLAIFTRCRSLADMIRRLLHLLRNP